MSDSLRVLFYKKTIAWPFQSGHDVHTFHLMCALKSAGHRVGLVTTKRPPSEALAAIPLDFERSLSADGSATDTRVGFNRIEEQFRSYWGVPEAHVRELRDSAMKFRADAVVVSGLEVLPFACGLTGPVRIWYAADEWVLHHLSQVKLFEPESWRNLKDAAIKGVYERTFKHRLDRAWAVSDADRKALRWISGVDQVDVLPNGVDPERYFPQQVPVVPSSAVFWGRLDFGPNIQALQWFCSHVWPEVVRRRPEARFTIIGFKPGPEVAALAQQTGVEIKPDVDDLRRDVASHAVAVLPFVSGHGVKNKLLEAAAMGKAIVCTPRTLAALQGCVPILSSRHSEDWVNVLLRFWDDEELREQRGRQAREWVVREHTWAAAARVAVAGIEESLQRRRAS